jgi:Uma2 family endonuclease
MATVATRSKPAPKPPPRVALKTVADLLQRLGNIPPHRVWVRPTLGTATEGDVIAASEVHHRRCELVEGVLVEKDNMGFEESLLASILIIALGKYLDRHDLGLVAGEQGAVRLRPGLVRYPDVAFISWERLPKGKRRQPIPRVAPDLVVEILSRSNTPEEITRKLREYFHAKVRLVWVVDPRKRIVRAYTGPETSTLLRESDTIDGGEVLPGFRLAIREWFAKAEREGPRSK